MYKNIPFEYQNEILKAAQQFRILMFEDTGAIQNSFTTSIA